MISGNLKKLFYNPVKSLSFNECDNLEISNNSGINNDRCMAFTRGLNKQESDDYKNNPDIRNLNFFLTLKNSPFLKKYNFVFDGSSNLILYLKNNKLIEININNSKEVKNIEKFIEDIDQRIKKPIYFIYNKESPFFDTTPNISVSLINLNSIKDLENKLNLNINLERFRGNLYIDNINAWQEFQHINKIITVGSINFKVISKIPRCSITNINPKNYEIDINLPNKLDELYGHKYMGIYLTPINSGIINVSDKVIFN